MKLREEIAEMWIETQDGAVIRLVPEEVEGILAKVKQWALEMVGKDTIPFIKLDNGGCQDDYYFDLGAMQVKGEIRQRIEESIKK